MLGTAAIDIIRYVSGETGFAYSMVFAAQAALFVSAAALAAQISRPAALQRLAGAGAATPTAAGLVKQ